MNKLTKMIVAASAMLPLATMATTVAYWPLAKDNGVRLAQGDTLANSVPGGADAVVAHIRIASGTVNNASASVHANDWPMGTNAFPTAFGVYDPVAKENLAAATGLDFGRDTFKKNWNTTRGCPWISCVLQAADFDAGKTESFTVEFFVKPDPAYKSRWQVLAAMPLSTEGHDEYKTGKESWAIFLNDSGNIYAKLCYDETKGSYSSNPATAKIWDDRWHHIAMTVDGTAFKLFVDYDLVRSGTLDGTVKFSEDGHLFIGGTTHHLYSYAGSMAHFRVSDKALSSEDFLHFTRTTRAADEPEDVVLHLDFEPVDGLSTNKTVIFNRAATGSAVHLNFNENYAILDYCELDEDVCAETLYAARTGFKGVANSASFNRLNTPSTATYPYIAWYPADDIFHDYAFTVEMFLKTSEAEKYKPYLRRRGGTAANGGVQFTIGTGGTAGKLYSGLYVSRNTASELVSDSEWHHIAIVYDKDNKKQYLYSDWEQTGSTVTINESANNFITASANPITILGDPGDSTGSIAKIDEVRITKRALGWKEFITSECAKGLIISFH